MKSKAILLSGIILGGFTAPVVESVKHDHTALATEHVAEGEQRGSKTLNVSAQQPTDSQSIVKIGEPVDLKKLNENSQFEIPLTLSSTGEKFQLQYTEAIGKENFDEFSRNNEFLISISSPELDTEFTWGGHLTLSTSVRNVQVKYNPDKQIFELCNRRTGTMTTFNSINVMIEESSARVKTVLADTGETIDIETIENAYSPEQNGIELNDLKQKGKIVPGYFDSTRHFVSDPSKLAWEIAPEQISLDLNQILKQDGILIYKLEKAKPVTVSEKVFLNGIEFSTNEASQKIWTTPKDNPDAELPDQKYTILDPEKCRVIRMSDYNDRIVDDLTGSAAIAEIEKNQGDLINSELRSFTDAKLIDEKFAGAHVKYELHYKLAPDVVVADVSIQSNLGEKIVKEVYGKKGEIIKVDVPEVEGYEVDKKQVSATVTDDGKIITNETVKYTNDEADTGINPPTTEPPIVEPPVVTPPTVEPPVVKPPVIDPPTVEPPIVQPPVIDPVPGPWDFDGFVGTMKKTVSMFELTDGKMTKVKRDLAPHTDWKATKIIMVDGIKYYRVSTNEWVKTSDIYRYENAEGVVKTKNSVAKLDQSDKQDIKHRGLGANTSWKYDRIGYLGENEEKHYRVSSDEFFADDK
jgi:hypothetical protein